MPATGRDGLSDEAGGTRHIRPYLGALAGTTHARATRADSFTGPRFHRRAGVGGACSSGNPNRSECHLGQSETGRHLHPRNPAATGCAATGAELRRHPTRHARGAYADEFERLLHSRAVRNVAERIEKRSESGRIAEAKSEPKALEEAYARLCAKLRKGAA